MEMIQEADRLGYYVVWTAEAYGSDAVVPLTWIGAHTTSINLGTAIMQMPGRTPANTAMTAMTLDQLSGGRMILGLGLSGPQVVEGWHGLPYGKKPLKKTREYVEILRKIFAREEPLSYDGDYYQIPYQGDDATGLGKPLKSILHGRDLPIYIASIGPKNVRLTAEIAEGWLPIFFAPRIYDETFKESVDEGLAKAGKTLDDFDIAANVTVVLDDDVEMARNQVKPMLALYIGGMGAKGKNFYYDLAVRFGFEEDAEKIQGLFLGGNKGEAMMAVPDALVDEVALCGPADRIKDQFQMWKDSPVTTLNVATSNIDAVRLMAELAL
jgi:F420-dependent oxidoreductase-like protein